MAVNLATKYSSHADERFSQEALTDKSVNKDYDFVGAKSVKVYSMGTSKMNDYKPSGSNRYGTPEELEDENQELTMRKMRSFTFTIDKTHAIDSPEGLRNAGVALRRQLDEVVIPEVDAYRLCQMSENAGYSNVSEITASNAYSVFTDCTAILDENEVPSEGRVAHVAPSFLNLLKKDPNFIKTSDISQKIVIKGQVGEVDGVAIIKTTPKRLPSGVSFIITHPKATTAPVKLAEYKIHSDPPGLAGHLVEGLVYYDAFVLNNKKNAVAVHYGTTGQLKATMTASESGKGIVSVSNNRGGTLVYKTGASQSAVSIGADVSSWNELTEEITATSGHKLVVAVSVDGKAVASSEPITVSVGA